MESRSSLRELVWTKFARSSTILFMVLSYKILLESPTQALGNVMIFPNVSPVPHYETKEAAEKDSVRRSKVLGQAWKID
jgi:hypothetical protein